MQNSLKYDFLDQLSHMVKKNNRGKFCLFSKRKFEVLDDQNNQNIDNFLYF